MLAKAEIGSGLSQMSKAQSVSPRWVSEIYVLEPSPAAPTVYINRKLELQAESGNTLILSLGIGSSDLLYQIPAPILKSYLKE